MSEFMSVLKVIAIIIIIAILGYFGFLTKTELDYNLIYESKVQEQIEKNVKAECLINPKK